MQERPAGIGKAAILLLLSLLPLCGNAEVVPPRPSFLVIVADDMGWSDLGAFGSEIRTPTLDALAASGMTMTRFYVGPTCSPTRAMLMTGVDNHLAGLGTMAGVEAPNQLGSRNYAAQLHDDVVSLAEGLKTAGYATLMSGKWHLAKDRRHYPHARGFDRSFVLGEGGASHFSDALPLYRDNAVTYLEDGVEVELPEDFYSTIDYTDKMLGYLQEIPEATPFLAYVAYTAPHDPLQVPEQWLNKYAGVYSEGPAKLRAQRIRALTAQGLIPQNIPTWTTPQFPAFLPTHVPPWDRQSAEEQALASRPMEIYAAMIELMDQQIQRLLDALAASGRLDNTYVIFLSDNGANGALPLSYPNMSREWFNTAFNHTLEQVGRPGSHPFQGREWSWVSASPFKLYKGAVSEGGIRAPLIVSGPQVAKGARSSQTAHVTDIPATLYQLAGIDPQLSTAFAGKLLPDGRSLSANWQQANLSTSRRFATELFGSRAVVWDSWKATNMAPPLGSGEWELYDLDTDPGEMNDIAEKHPEQLAQLVKFYDDYAHRVGVVLPHPPVTPSFGDLFTGECHRFCEITVSLIDWLITVWQRLASFGN